MDRVRFVTVPYDDTWLRDSGPISLHDGDDFRLLDFRFTGWGGKFDASVRRSTGATPGRRAGVQHAGTRHH